MSQVSRPVQVLLLLTVCFGALWFLMLRPKSPPSAPPQPAPAPAPANAPQSSFGRAVDKAKQGRAQAEGAAAGRDAASDAVDNPGAGKTDPSTAAPNRPPTTQPGTGGPNTPGKVKAADLPKPVARALEKRKVVLLLFWNRSSTDDRAVRAEFRRVDRRRGRVYVAAAPLSKLGSYGAITRGVQVLQSPTLVVIDRQRRASTIIGYTDATEIDQRVSDVLNGRSAPVATPPAPPVGAAPPAGTTP